MVDGIGGVGILVIQAAAHAGARVIAVGDAEDEAPARARPWRGETRSSWTPPRATTGSPSTIRGLTDGRGTDVFFELVGTTRTMAAGIRSLAKGGRFVSTGYTDQPLEIHPIEFILPEASLVSTVAATRLDLQDALSLSAVGAMTVPIAGRYPLDGVETALGALRERGVLGRQILDIT